MSLPLNLRLLIPACSVLCLAALQARDPESAWDKAANFLVQDAYHDFQKSAEDMEPKARDFGLAITLLNVQPRTRENLDKSRELLTGLVETLPENDPLRPLAKFFRARILDFYGQGENLDSAKQDYRDAVLSGAGNPVTETGAARLVFLEGYSKKPPIERLAAIQHLEPLAEHLKTPAGQREFHHAMAYAILDNKGDKAAVLEHFLAADRAGYTRKNNMVAAWIIAAKLATDMEKPEIAREYYTKFLTEYPKDPRAHTIRQLLSQLEASHD